MLDGNKFVFEARNLVWFANTRKSEFDFISIPKEPDFSTIVWGNFRRKVLQNEEIPYYGLLQDGDTIWPFVAIKHRDLNRQDNTGHRVIIHDIIWIPPNLKDLKDKEAIKKAIPHNWFKQVWEASLDAVYAEVHSLDQEGVIKRVAGMSKIPLKPTSESHENWKCVDDVISSDKLEEGGTEIPQARTETDSETGKKTLEIFKSSASETDEGKTDRLFQITKLLVGGGVGVGMALLIPPVGVVSSGILGAVAADKIYNRLLKK